MSLRINDINCGFATTVVVVHATIGGHALSHDRCNIFPGLSYNKTNDTVLNSVRKNDVEGQVEFTLKVLERARDQGWRSAESSRLPPMRPGFESWRRRHMWVEFVVGSLPLLREVFLRVLQFSPLLKNQHFQIPIRSGTHGHVSTSSYELLSAPWVNKLQFTIYVN